MVTHAEPIFPETIENITLNPNADNYRSVDFPAFARDPRSRNALKLLGLAAVNQGGLSIAQRDSARRVLAILEADS